MGSAFDSLLKDRFGFTSFRPGQREVIEALAAHQAALAVFPTGGGKSLCYQLPALAYEGVTVVVSPLIALMKDQIDFLRARGIDAARLDSSLSEDESNAVAERVRAASLKLLYVAPERFNNERFLALMKRTRIALFVVDEAHCISEWGHNFRPDYLKLAQTARALGVERVLALTATATPGVVKDICAAFAIPPAASVVTGFYRPNLELRTTPVASYERDAVLVAKLRSRAPGPTIVYVTLQKTAEQLAQRLERDGFAARAYHAGLEAEERSAIQDWWMSGKDRVVVATIAFGMGIDKADVRYVYHYNLPKSLESYSQEIGRAGRDGAPSTVELLACPEDVPALENFAFGDTPTEAALGAFVDEVLRGGPNLDVSLYELSGRLDLRPLVLKTALTYLELLGVLEQGTPYYAGYELRPLVPVERIVAQFEGERAQFVSQLFARAKKGRTWYALDPAKVGAELGQPRERVTRAIDYLQESGLAETRVSEPRQRYRRLRPAEDAAALKAELGRRFRTREEQEIRRLQQVLELVTLSSCQVNALVGHFGERRPGPCGHCSFCETGRPVVLPQVQAGPSLQGLDGAAVAALRRQHGRALGEARQLARFLCGLSSPALTATKLTRHALYGAAQGQHFGDVLRWCQQLSA